MSPSTFDPARLDGRLAALLALASGATLVLAFAPFGLWPLAILMPALLFRLLHGRRPVAGFGIGYLFGLGLLGLGVSWLKTSIGQFGGITPPLAVLLTVAFVLFVALYFGLLGYLLARLLRGQATWVGGMIFAAAWLLLEWLRGWLFTGSPGSTWGRRSSTVRWRTMCPWWVSTAWDCWWCGRGCCCGRCAGHGLGCCWA